VKNLSHNASRYAATSAKLMPPHRGTAHLRFIAITFAT
jgi:hypothetical protein